MERECEHLLSYMAGTLDDIDKAKFERHLEQCEVCRKEYEDLTDSWEALQFDFEEQEVPESLKAEVFDFVFRDEQKEGNPSVKDRIKAWGILLKKQFTPLSAGLVAILFAITAALTYTNVQSAANQPSTIKQPAEIIASLNLTSANEAMRDAGGYAYVVKDNQVKKLVVHVNGMPKLKGSKIYQVWMLKGGKRTNAGMFNTNDSGSGVLTYTLSDDEDDFENIGITMEPSQNNTQPQGEKVIGS
ncbi:anti-sigma factor [Lentibacillus cibarius]|uniref:Anti-sigma-W factor RsiW n=1 Tax=Lentibacillus cibarius TaxID=2583219 RepID=A0A5S3QPI8_9BACI|nr:anti-sigma factor [Lentibacillus cibarius]TMN23864.1 anti-sigma factor [Lentibacillus cibarius]